MTDKNSWWYVGLFKNDKVYYAADTDTEGTVMWCTDRKDAVKFMSEKAVQDFVNKVMFGRTDIHLINAESD